MTDLDHKRRQARSEADRYKCPFVIYVTPDDFEPMLIDIAPEWLIPEGVDVLEKIYPRNEL